MATQNGSEKQSRLSFLQQNISPGHTFPAIEFALVLREDAFVFSKFVSVILCVIFFSKRGSQKRGKEMQKPTQKHYAVSRPWAEERNKPRLEMERKEREREGEAGGGAEEEEVGGRKIREGEGEGEAKEKRK